MSNEPSAPTPMVNRMCPICGSTDVHEHVCDNEIRGSKVQIHSSACSKCGTDFADPIQTTHNVVNVLRAELARLERELQQARADLSTCGKIIEELNAALAAAQAENAKLVDASVRDLATEVEHWRAENAQLRKELEDGATEDAEAADKFQAEAAQNAKDAERYRYIRGVHWAFGEPETDGTFSWKLAFHGCAEHLDSEEAMDVAIDAAIGVLPAAGKAKP